MAILVSNVDFCRLKTTFALSIVQLPHTRDPESSYMGQHPTADILRSHC